MKAQVATFFLLLCFLAFASSEKRGLNIVGGAPAVANQFPFQVFVVVSGPMGSFQCGGFLVDASHVGTAAHCFDSQPTSFYAQAGTINVTDQSTGQVRNGASVNIHPLYNGTTFDYDAAIITLVSPFTVDGVTVKVATLATSQPAPGTTVYVSGWGKTSTAGPTSNFLLFVDVPTVSFSSCKTNFWSSIINGVSICAGGTVGKDTCQGDSGGALFTTSNINNPVDAQIIGIVSFGDAVGCATSTPTVYSDVPGFAAAFFQQIITGSSPSVSASTLPSVAVSSAGASSGLPSLAVSSIASSPSAAAASSAAASASRAASSAAGSVAAVTSSGAVLPSVSSSTVVAASSASVGQSQSQGQSQTQAAATSSGAFGASQSQTQTGTSSGSHTAPVSASPTTVKSSIKASSKAPANKTPTGIAAANCRTACQKIFKACKKTTRRLRTCKNAKKTCVSKCGVINPNK